MNRTLINQYEILHSSKVYGNSSGEFSNIINDIIKIHNINSVLDYGCGQSRLIDIINVPIKKEFDPAISNKSILPSEQFDLVTCIDVLEHIPEIELSELLNEITSMSSKVLFNISCRLAAEILPNGLNAHVTVHTKEWWCSYLIKYFNKITQIKYREIQKDIMIFCENKKVK